MAAESKLWESVGPRLTSLGLDPHRVENVLGVGTPDVNYAHGWIELKDLEAWPSGADTRPVNIPSLVKKKEQVVWLKRRWHAGGLTWLMVRVAREAFLFSGLDAQEVRRGLTRPQMRELACWHACPPFFPDEVKRLHHWLTGDAEAMSLPDKARFCRLRACKEAETVALDLGWSLSDVLLAEQELTDSTHGLIDYWLA